MQQAAMAGRVARDLLGTDAQGEPPKEVGGIQCWRVVYGGGCGNRASRRASYAVELRPFLTLIPEMLTHCAPAARDTSLDKGVGSQSAGNFPKNSGIFFVHHSFTRVGSNSDMGC